MALYAMRSLPPDDLAARTDALRTMLNDGDAGVREAALGAMGNLPPDVLAEHADVLLRSTCDARS